MPLLDIAHIKVTRDEVISVEVPETGMGACHHNPLALGSQSTTLMPLHESITFGAAVALLAVMPAALAYHWICTEDSKSSGHTNSQKHAQTMQW